MEHSYSYFSQEERVQIFHWHAKLKGKGPRFFVSINSDLRRYFPQIPTKNTFEVLIVSHCLNSLRMKTLVFQFRTLPARNLFEQLLMIGPCSIFVLLVLILNHEVSAKNTRNPVNQ